MQEAEYRNRKEGMETGWTEEERSTGGTADRGEREEGKRKNGRLSSQNQTEVDERKRKRGKSPKARAKAPGMSLFTPPPHGDAAGVRYVFRGKWKVLFCVPLI